MAIILDHTIVPAHDKEASARWFAHIFGLAYEGPAGHFAPVRVNDTLTLDFDDHEGFEVHHYAFHITDAEFDAIMRRVLDAGIPYGSGPGSLEDGQIGFNECFFLLGQGLLGRDKVMKSLDLFASKVLPHFRD